MSGNVLSPPPPPPPTPRDYIGLPANLQFSLAAANFVFENQVSFWYIRLYIKHYRLAFLILYKLWAQSLQGNMVDLNSVKISFETTN